MKFTALAIVLLAASSAIAKPRDWKPATVTLISSSTEQTGAVVMPLYGGLAGSRVYVTRIEYRIDTDDTTFTLVKLVRSWVRRDHPLNLTLHGTTKIALDANGHDAHILDDGGKDVKVPITEKVAHSSKCCGPTR